MRHVIQHNEKVNTNLKTIFANLMKWKNFTLTLIVQSMYSLLCRSTFGSSYITESFGFDATSFAHLELGVCCHCSFQISGALSTGDHFNVSPEMLNWVQIRGFAQTLMNIQSCPYATPTLPWLCAEGDWLVAECTFSSVWGTEPYELGFQAVQKTWWVMPCFLQTQYWELRPNSSILASSGQIILFLTVWVSFRYFHEMSKQAFMCLFEERPASGHSDVKPKSVECCSDSCPCGSHSQIHTGSLELSQSDHLVRGHLRSPQPGPSLAGPRLLVVPTFFHLRILEALTWGSLMQISFCSLPLIFGLIVFLSSPERTTQKWSRE